MKAYAIKRPDNILLPSSIRSEEEFCKDQFAKYDWHIKEKEGYRCVPVEITEITKEKV